MKASILPLMILGMIAINVVTGGPIEDPKQEASSENININATISDIDVHSRRKRSKDGCVCKNLLNEQGDGDCDGVEWCFVLQPSSCNDLQESNDLPGEKLSYEACSVRECLNTPPATCDLPILKCDDMFSLGYCKHIWKNFEGCSGNPSGIVEDYCQQGCKQCGKGGIDAPCSTSIDCATGLICRNGWLGSRFCVGCDSSDFQCSNGECIPASYECNGVNDCGDWSDEQNCVNCHNNLPTSEQEIAASRKPECKDCGTSKSKCDSSQCILDEGWIWNSCVDNNGPLIIYDDSDYDDL